MFVLVRCLSVLLLFSNAARADWGEGQVIYEGEPSFIHEGNGGIAVTGASLTNAGSMLSAPSAKSSSSASLSGVPAGSGIAQSLLGLGGQWARGQLP